MSTNTPVLNVFVLANFVLYYIFTLYISLFNPFPSHPDYTFFIMS